MRQRLRHVPATLAVCGAVGAAALAIGWAGGGATAGLGALAGVGLVVLSYMVSTLAIAWADTVNPQLVFPVGMAAYLTKFGIFGLVLVALLDSGWNGLTALAMGIVVGVVAWSGAQIWWVVTHPVR